MSAILEAAARRWLGRLAIGLLALIAGATATAQGGGAIRAPQQVDAGASLTVDVASNDTTVEVASFPGSTTSHPVGPDGKAVIPVPNVPDGTVLFVSVGTGRRRQVVLVEVVTPP